jgi:hypothetical protein
MNKTFRFTIDKDGEKTDFEVQSDKQIEEADARQYGVDFHARRKKKFEKLENKPFAHLPHVDLRVDKNGKAWFVGKNGELLDDAPMPRQLRVTQGRKRNLEKHTRQVLTKLQRRIKRR